MKAHPYTLDCEHVVWHAIAPEPGAIIYCHRCQNYRVFPTQDERGTYYPDDDWTSYPKGKVVRGVCKRCDHEETGPLTTVRTFFHRHALRGCRPITNEYTINVVDLPRNSPPPF